MQHLWYYLITINAVAFLLMLIDKRSSRKKLWRIPEAWLLTIAVLGGSLGTTVGMFVFRHQVLWGNLSKNILYTIASQPQNKK